MSEFEKYQEKAKERKRLKKEKSKQKKEQEKKMAKMSEKQIKEMEKKRQQLQMLVGDAKDDDEVKFEGNANDPRFSKTLATNKEFSLDPTHKDFHKMADGAFVKKNKSQKR